MDQTRRSALALGSFVAGIAMAGLAACGVTEANHVTTVTVDTGRIDRDGQAVLAAAAKILSSTTLQRLLGSNLAVAQSALADATKALAAIDTATQGKAQASIDTASVQGFANSMVTDVHNLLSLSQQVMSGFTDLAEQATVNDYIQAILTLLPFIQLAVGLGMAAKAQVRPMMSEAQAVTICGE